MPKLIGHLKCTGCAACYVSCPQDAIQMRPDQEGFVFPLVDESRCVNCGLCERRCPVRTVGKRDATPMCYAAKSNNIRLVLESSSGGMFSELALPILRNGGVVFGAAYDDKTLDVKHIAVQTVEDLSKLRGSKYVQSEVGLIYRQVKDVLIRGCSVLFSGTPCQIAGLKAYLGENYDKLLTVEVICHGVPSPKLFDELKREMSKRHGALATISFRDKSEGWSSRAITGWYVSGKKIREKGNLNDYFKAFLSRLILRHSCEDCQFNDGKSGADVTLGDFWGAGCIKEWMNDDTGISAVILHTAKGVAAFEQLNCYKHMVSLCDIARLNPSYQALRKPNEDRNEFMSLALGHDVHVATRKYLREKCPTLLHRIIRKLRGVDNCVKMKKIAISTLGEVYLLSNYGTFFQHYALRRVLSGMGFTPFRVSHSFDRHERISFLRDWIVDAVRPVYWFLKMMPDCRVNCCRMMDRDILNFLFLKDYQKLIGRFREPQDFKNAMFGVMGGDQILGTSDNRLWLTEMPEESRCITYAASSDWMEKRHNEQWQAFAKRQFERFHAIGIREQTGVAMCRELVDGGKVVAHVADPVMLLDALDYERIADKNKIFKQPTLFCYLVNIESEEELLIGEYEKLAVMLGCELKMVGIQGAERYIPKQYKIKLSPVQFLRAIIDADYVITNSYHGSVFAAIFGKNFLSVWQHCPEGTNQNERQKEFMMKFGLSLRWVDWRAGAEKWCSALDEPVNWSLVHNDLDAFRCESIKWLREALDA